MAKATKDEAPKTKGERVGVAVGPDVDKTFSAPLQIVEGPVDAPAPASEES